MPKSWIVKSWILQQWRRVVMQITLWVVLGATVALATLVVHEKRRSLRLPLEDPKTFGMLRVSLPKTWAPHSVPRGTDGGDLVTADEPAAEGETGRRLTVARMRTTGWVAPLEHLFLSHMLSEKDLSPGLGRGDPPRVEPLEVGGWPGQLVTQNIPIDARRGMVRKELIACAILPSSQALVIELSGQGVSDAADDQLVRQMAETVVVSGVPDLPEPGGAVELPYGITLAVPSNFRALSSDDPNRTSRDLLLSASSAWASVELIPCVFFPADNDETLLTMLSAHDRGWQGAVVHEAGARVWQVDKPNTKAFPTRAYLLANGEDQGLLAIFHGGYHDAGYFDGAWQALVPTVRFAGRSDLGEMLKTGGEEAQRLADEGTDKLLPPTGEQRWSLWDQRENVGEVPWMRLAWPWSRSEGVLPEPGTGMRLVSPLDPYSVYGTRPAFERTWKASSDGSAYTTQQVELQVDDKGNVNRMVLNTISRLVLEDGRLRSEWPQTNAPPRVPPNQFVVGGWLPLLLGHLSDKPMILRTDNFVGCDGTPLPGLLTLLITRAAAGPAKPDEMGEPMDCVIVNVNGTGQLSRWYFAKDGALRYIDLADGLREAGDSTGMIGDPPPTPSPLYSGERVGVRGGTSRAAD